MAKRQLTEEELKIYKKNISRMEDDKKYLIYMKEYIALMIEKGIWENYKKQLREFENNKKETDLEINEIDAKVSEMVKHINEGVEIKKEDKNG